MADPRLPSVTPKLCGIILALSEYATQQHYPAHSKEFLRLPMSFCRYAGLTYERSPVCDPRHWSSAIKLNLGGSPTRKPYNRRSKMKGNTAMRGEKILRDGTRSHWSHRLRREHGRHPCRPGSDSTTRSPI